MRRALTGWINFVTERPAEHLLLSLAARHFGQRPSTLLRGNPRALNFDLASAAVLQRHDAERDESQRKFNADIVGAKLADTPVKSQNALPTNGQKRSMTAQDIMRNYGS